MGKSLMVAMAERREDASRQQTSWKRWRIDISTHLRALGLLDVLLVVVMSERGETSEWKRVKEQQACPRALDFGAECT